MHELGHAAAARGGLDGKCEQIARYLTGALLVPRHALLRDVRRGLDLERLYTRHEHASAEAIARRVVQVFGGGGAIWDHGRRSKSFGEPIDVSLADIATEPSRNVLELPGRVAFVSVLTHP